eukprot:SAG11_NODE_50_length_19992_cov_9.945157_3_plen_287_part_00
MADYSRIKSFLAGGGGGASLAIVGQPLDTIKVRIQTGQSVGVLPTGLNIVKKEGILALWKGVVPPLLSCTPMYALCFFGYDTGKKLFCDDDAFEPGNFKLGQIGCAGAFSAVFTTPVMAPQERLKCVLQTQKAGPDGKLPTIGMVARNLYEEGGFLNLTRGAGVTVLRDASASFMYFSTYEVMKYQIRINFTKDGRGDLSLGHFILAGGVAGIFNWLPVRFPHLMMSSFSSPPPPPPPPPPPTNYVWWGGGVLETGAARVFPPSFVFVSAPPPPPPPRSSLTRSPW